MTALSDALQAAQARAVAAIGKSYTYAPEPPSHETVCAMLDVIGLTDHTEQHQWLEALDVLRLHGSQPPGEAKPQPNGQPEQATSAQVSFIGKLCADKGFPVPEGPFTKEQAHEIIDSLKQGSYDPDKWTVPF